MNTEETKKGVGLHLVTKIISGYLSNHKVEPDQLSTLIVSVDQTLRELGKAPGTPPVRTPAVPIRRSVGRDHVICLECGFKGKTLRRHLQTRHDLKPAGYLARWGLPPDHPLTAPSYSEQRSAMARRIGLGMRRQGRRQRRRRAEA